jgi:hypothetical protein
MGALLMGVLLMGALLMGVLLMGVLLVGRAGTRPAPTVPKFVALSVPTRKTGIFPTGSAKYK